MYMYSGLFNNSIGAIPLSCFERDSHIWSSNNTDFFFGHSDSTYCSITNVKTLILNDFFLKSSNQFMKYGITCVCASF